jgi:hypothetical protein
MHALDQAWETVRRDSDAACLQAAQAARLQLTTDLNHAARRLRQYQSEEDWITSVLSAIERFVDQAALFTVDNDTARLRGKYQFELPHDFSFPIASAPAFANAIASKDSIVSLRTQGEVGDRLSAASPGQRAHIIPILNGNRVSAILFAASQDRVDLNGLELVATMASLVLERQTNTAKSVQITAPIPASPHPPQNRELPPWSALNDDQRNLHLRAQRFSRVKVAEMQLARPEACRAGLEQNDVYLFLKKEIDAARETYRTQFMKTPSMVDYFHLELVRTAADGEESKLGADYPGQLA